METSRGVPPGPAWGGHPARLWPLAAVAVAVIALATLGVLPRWPGLVHLVALPPLDLFTDVRVLLTDAASVPAFVVVLAVVLAVRVAVLALLLGGLTRHRLRFAALFYLAALPVMVVIAALDFTAHAILYARVFWPAVAAVALVVLVAGPVPWQVPTAAPKLWSGLGRSLRAGLRVEIMAPYAVVLVAIGALADVAGTWAAVALVPVSALATAVTIRLLARPVTGRPLVRLAVATVLAVLVSAGFVVTRTVETPPAAPPRAGSLLLMSGVDSSSGSGSIFETEVEVLGYDCDQVYYFSYAGTGDGAPQGDATCPIRTGAPYQPHHTLRPLAEQVELFSAQVSDLPRPLVVSGHSLAAWVAWEAVATGAAPEVDVLILVGPFPDSPVSYPPPHMDGTGRVGGELVRALMPLAQVLDLDFDPDAPASRELLATAEAGAAIFGRPLPEDVRALSITTTADLPLMPGGWRLPVERNACPIREAHPDLPENPALYDEVNRFLAQGPPRSCPRWQDWGAPMARPFGVPPARPGLIYGDRGSP